MCKENVPIVTFLPNEDCESTLIHPYTNSILNKVCEQKGITLKHAYWISLHLNNEWFLLLLQLNSLFIVWEREILINFTKSWKIVSTSRMQGIFNT